MPNGGCGKIDPRIPCAIPGVSNVIPMMSPIPQSKVNAAAAATDKSLRNMQIFSSNDMEILTEMNKQIGDILTTLAANINANTKTQVMPITDITQAIIDSVGVIKTALVTYSIDVSLATITKLEKQLREIIYEEVSLCCSPNSREAYPQQGSCTSCGQSFCKSCGYVEGGVCRECDQYGSGAVDDCV